jgi:hypothetical protein
MYRLGMHVNQEFSASATVLTKVRGKQRDRTGMRWKQRGLPVSQCFKKSVQTYRRGEIWVILDYQQPMGGGGRGNGQSLD